MATVHGPKHNQVFAVQPILNLQQSALGLFIDPAMNSERVSILGSDYRGHWTNLPGLALILKLLHFTQL